MICFNLSIQKARVAIYLARALFVRKGLGESVVIVADGHDAVHLLEGRA